MVPSPEYDLVGCLESMWHFGRVNHAGSELDSDEKYQYDSVIDASATKSSPVFADPSAKISLTPQNLVQQGLQITRAVSASAQKETKSSSTSDSHDQHGAAEYSHPLYPLFRLLDEDSDGQVSLDEMHSLLRKLGKDEVSRSCLVSLIESVNPDIKPGPMAVDFSQFTTLYESLYGDEEAGAAAQEEDDELLDAFHVYDRNRDGFISASELATVLVELGLLAADAQDAIGPHVEKCQALIDRVDSDSNGLVDLQEFKAMFAMCSATSGRSCDSSATPTLNHHEASIVCRG